MSYLKYSIFTILAVLLILPFQNCSGPSPIFSSQLDDTKADNTSPEGSTNGDSNGQPYDGKIYVHTGATCSDGTLVDSRIVINSSTSATLVRLNCQNIAPVQLTSADFQISSNGSQLTYQNKTYVPEISKLTLPPSLAWNYQLSGTMKITTAQLYDIDFQGYDAATVASLKAAGKTVICYVPAGFYEADRPDASSFQPSDIGNPLYAGATDRWLDTRSANVRKVAMTRLDAARNLGCDGVDFDSVDAFTSNSGFPLNAQTQMDFNTFLAFAAHDRGMIVALNNVPDLAKDLEPYFDFLIAEQCYETNACTAYQPFLAAGKPVLDAEYRTLSSTECSSAKASGISLTYFSSNLDGTRREVCP